MQRPVRFEHTFNAFVIFILNRNASSDTSGSCCVSLSSLFLYPYFSVLDHYLYFLSCWCCYCYFLAFHAAKIVWVVTLFTTRTQRAEFPAKPAASPFSLARWVHRKWSSTCLRLRNAYSRPHSAISRTPTQRGRRKEDHGLNTDSMKY